MKANIKAIQYSVLILLSIPLILIATGRSSDLSCEKLEKDYVMCQLEQRYIHGLWPTIPQDFRLNEVSIKSQLHQDEEGDYYTYKTYLRSPDKKHLFHNYGRFKFLAEMDQEKLNQLMNGPSQLSLHLTRSYILNDIYLFFILPIFLLWGYLTK